MFFVHKLELVVLLMAKSKPGMGKKKKSADYKVEQKAGTEELTYSISLPQRRGALKRKSASWY